MCSVRGGSPFLGSPAWRRAPGSPAIVVGIVPKMSMPVTLNEVAAAIIEVLADGAVRDEDDLISALAERPVDLGKRPLDAVVELLESDDLPLVVSVEDGYVLLSVLLRGRTFTHRLTAVEVERDVIATGPDLAPLWCMTDVEEYLRLVDGTELVEAVRGFDDDLLAERGNPDDLPDDFVWMLPAGTLARHGVAAGDLVGITVRDDGFELGVVGTVDGAVELGERLAECLGQRGEGEPDEVSDVVWQACVEDPGLFRALQPPLGDAIEAGGFAQDGDLIGPSGFDFARWRTAKRVNRIASMHRIGEDEAFAVLALSRVYDDVALVLQAVQDAPNTDEALDTVFAGPTGEPADVTPGTDPRPDPISVRELVVRLEDPAVVGALLVEAIGAGRDGAATLGLFAETLEEQSPRSCRAPSRWLRGKALERMGRVLEAEAAFEAALDLDGEHVPSLYDLARYASDRGDAERGLSLLRRAGAPADDDLVAVLTHFCPTERTDIGRNEPCWCGSGRKYKVCHRNRESLPLADRAAWLYQKAETFLSDGPWRESVIDVAEVRADHWGGEGAVWEAINEGLAGDLVLFEGGAFEEFVAERGVLLPDDERILADQWLLVDRSVHEIQAVSPGVGFTARDVRTGDRVEVREGTASRSLKVGALICARLVPAGDTVQLFGGYEVLGLRERDHVIALLDEGAEPEELVAALSGRFAPPQLQNTEGEPLVMCDATLLSSDPAALAELLDTTYDRVDGEEGQWIEHVTTQGAERIRATLELDGEHLRVESNSEARLDRVLTRVRELQPGLTLTSEARKPIADVQEAMTRAPFRGTSATLDPDDPAVAAALTEFIRNQEQAWLDEPIPALAGATPREAAADPTRHPDLLRLLNSHDRPTAAGLVTMDPARLRTALGLY